MVQQSFRSLFALIGPLLFGGCLRDQTRPASANITAASLETSGAPGEVRYIVRDIDRAIAFYTNELGFHLDLRDGSGFAMISRGNLQLILSGPDSADARPAPGGPRQQPGGDNRIVLFVDNLGSSIDRLEALGTHFRGQVQTGPLGKQVQIEDPDGNPIELHQR